MRFETSVLAAIAALPSVDANIVKHDDGIGSPRDATNPGNHGNRELAPAESPRAWAKITNPDAVKQEDGALLIPTKIGNSELVSMGSPSVWSEFDLSPSETMLKNVPLTTPPDDDNAKNQDMDPTHFSDLGILEKNLLPKEEVKEMEDISLEDVPLTTPLDDDNAQKHDVDPTHFLYLGVLERNLLPKEEVKEMEDILLEDEFQMSERDLEVIHDSCDAYCAQYTELPVFEDRQVLYDAVRLYCTSESCDFNDEKPINCWKVGGITDMTKMFHYRGHFNEPLKCWDVSKAESMSFMFYGANAFNQPVNKWNVSKVRDMGDMFYQATAFNQPVNKWDVSQVTKTKWMFGRAYVFNQPVNEWDVSKVEDMSYMFFDAEAFNQSVKEWDVSKVENMKKMFHGAEAFNQCLGTWPAKVLPSVTTDGMLQKTGCPKASDSDPSKNDKTWCQNEDHQCSTTLPKPFSIYKVERATNEEGQYANVKDENPVTIETFFKVKDDNDIVLELFHTVADGAPCTQGTPLNSGTTSGFTKIKANAEDSTTTYKAQYVIDVTNLVKTPAYNSDAGKIKICTTVAKKTTYDNGSPDSKYVSVVETSFTLTVKMEGNVSSDFVQTVTIEFDSGGGEQVGTVTNSVPVESFLCAPSRNADTKFKMGDEFGVCVRPDANAISNGYSVTSFESVECSAGDASTRTLISGSAIQDSLTKVLNDATTALDKDGNPAGAKAAGFTSLVTAGFFVDKTKTSFKCTGTVSLTKTDQSKRNRQRLLQEDSKTSSPFSTTIVLDTRNVASLSAGASMVSCVGVLLLSILVAMV